jgi:DNA-binding LacI/PurR family transcriptional regulator
MSMATISDVARAAGVSVSTVSYAISGARPIRPETRERIQSAMRSLGFQPNAMARSLASRRSRVIALIYPQIGGGIGGTAGEFVQSVAERAREAGYQLVLWPFRTDQAREIRNLARQRMADGVLLMEVCLDDERIDVLEAAKVPYAMIGRTRDVTERASVDIDHSGEQMSAGYGPAVRAAAAYDELMSGHGFEPLSRTCDDSPVTGRAVTAELLAADPALTAIITMNELATFGVYAELASQNLSIPGDVSVLGIVTSPGVGTLSYPPLTTMHSPGAELGRLAVDCLLSQLEPARSPIPNQLIPCVLEPGMSIGPARTDQDVPQRP